MTSPDPNANAGDWTTAQVDALVAQAGVGSTGTASLYTSATENKTWANNFIYSGVKTTYQGNGQGMDPSDYIHARNAQDAAAGQPYQYTPEEYLQKMTHTAGQAGQFALEAAQKHLNPQDWASQIFAGTAKGATNAEKTLAQAYFGWTSVQQMLNVAGFYGASSGPLLGTFHASDVTALHSAMDQYFQQQGQDGSATNPTTFDEFLKGQAAAATQGGFPGSTPPGSSGSGGSGTGFKATSPQDIVAQGDTQSTSMLGHSMDNTDQNSLISQVQGEQQAAFNQGDVYSRSVTPQAVAREFVLQNNLPEYTQHQAESYMNVFANMFLGGQSSRAQTSVGDAAVGTTGDPAHV